MLEIPTKLRAMVKRRLKDEYFVWLTTVGRDLTPQPRPVWFLWQDDSFLIYSQPDAHKIHHIEQHPRVALHFNADATGDNEILVFIGEARIDHDALPVYKNRAYVKKYGQGIESLKMAGEDMAREYSAAIRVTPTSVRGW